MKFNSMGNIFSKLFRNICPESPDYLCSNYTLQAGGSGPIMIDIGGDEKAVHADFFNGKFEG